MFQNCSVAERLAYILNIFLQFSPAREIFQIKDFEKEGMQEILKKSSKTEDRFTATSDLQNP